MQREVSMRSVMTLQLPSGGAACCEWLSDGRCHVTFRLHGVQFILPVGTEITVSLLDRMSRAMAK